jgi:adenine-specific DNA-methyltransferase
MSFIQPQKTISSKNGDIKIMKSFSLDNKATIYPGSCLDLLNEIPDQSVQLIITSPPYNIGKEYETRLEIDEYVSQQDKVISECVRVLKNEGSICWEIGNYVEKGEIIPLDILLYPCFKSKGLILRNRIVWNFGHGLHCTKRFSGRYEVIIWFTKSNNYTFNLDAVRIPQKYPGKKHFKGPNIGEYSSNPKGKNPSDVWEGTTDFWAIPNVKNNHIEKTDHPCQFPNALVQRLVLALSNERDIVFDPFLGVGSTAVAGVINNRKVAGSEMNSKYYNMACERVKLAYRKELKLRPDKSIYEPKGNLSIIKNPFTSNTELNIWK